MFPRSAARDSRCPAQGHARHYRQTAEPGSHLPGPTPLTVPWMMATTSVSHIEQLCGHRNMTIPSCLREQPSDMAAGSSYAGMGGRSWGENTEAHRLAKQKPP